MAFRIQINISRNRAPTVQIRQALEERVMEVAVESTQRTLMVRMDGLEARLRKAVEDSYTQAINYAANSMIGTLSPYAQDKRVYMPIPLDSRPIPGVPDHVIWKPLTQATRVRKLNYLHRIKRTNRDQSRGAVKFFVHTGRLRQQLKRFARNYARHTGLLQLFVRTEKGNIRASRRRGTMPVGALRMRVMPRVPLTALNPENSDMMRLEQVMGIPNYGENSAFNKLAGRKTHRPLLQPVMTFWTAYYIPNVITNALVSALDIREIRDQGLSDYSSTR